jgi:3-oxoisoapionate kinase
MNDLLLTFYGDDFTGSTDAMEALTLNGVPAVLFLEPPTPEFIQQHFPYVRAVGVAGVSRSMSPAEMDIELPPQFEALKSLGAPFFHYKICSTFDSSPTIGSIGHATEIGWRIFNPQVVPLMVGAPPLKRYVAFGNLFATVGEETYRLDRHPTMSKHPMTPMDESDLRLHLGKQTSRKIGLIDTLHLAQSHSEIEARFRSLMREGCEIILMDTLDQTHVLKIGALVWALRGEQPVFIVASSGIEYALTAYWQQVGMIQKPASVPQVDEANQLIVVSGSAAPGTAGQIEWAIANGFYPIRLKSDDLIDPNTAEQARSEAIAEALGAYRDGKSPLLYSTKGPDDPAIAITKQRMLDCGLDPKTVGSRLGGEQGMILRTLLEETGARRACVAGGDTCGHASRQLGIYALEVLTPIAPGAPLCRARSHNPTFDGLEIALKAGQVGKPNYFASVMAGKLL